jgi:hypothetical protein
MSAITIAIAALKFFTSKTFAHGADGHGGDDAMDIEDIAVGFFLACMFLAVIGVGPRRNS